MLLVVDNSFSMRAGTRLADAKDAAHVACSPVKAPRAGRSPAFGSQLRLMTQPIEDQAALRAAVQSIQPGDGHGNFGELSARGARHGANRSTRRSSFIVFSDMQRGDLAATFSDMALPANVKADDARRGHQGPAQLDRRIGGRARTGLGQGRQAGSRASRDCRLRHSRRAAHCLAGCERQDHRDQNGSGPGQRTRHRRLPALEVPYGFNRCEVKIDSADGFPADDLRRFAVQRSDPQKALLIHNYGDNRSPLYIGAALAAAAQSAFILESINVNEAADRKPSNYAFIILSDVNTVPSLLENSLTEYVRTGGSLLIAAGTSAGGRLADPDFLARSH